MNKDSGNPLNPSRMTDAAFAPSCARNGELVAYLYGEASATEAKSFAVHLQSCAECRTEFASFGDVRESIGVWRKESLGFLENAAPQHGIAALESKATIGRSARTALAALREFFTLSPAWMRAAASFAVLVVCALATVAVANAEFNWNASGVSFRTHLAPVRIIEKQLQVEKLVEVKTSEEELNAMVNERVQKRLDALRREGRVQPETVAALNRSIPARTPPAPRGLANPSMMPARFIPNTQLKRRSIMPQQEARADILDEKELPRLSDLLGESGDDRSK
ncbi:MAG: anti-sigma factor [Pyrinomonadaceae bacterium]